jgi:hypothetical protein
VSESSSEVDICNSALTLFGESMILSIDPPDGTLVAMLCAQHYHKQRNAALRAFPWGFAMKRAALNQLTSSPAWGFAYQYQIPTDCLRIWKIQHSSRTDWKREGDKLLTDLSSVNVRYISKVTDTNAFDSIFIDAIAARLAATICIAITGKKTTAEMLWALYKAKIEEAEEIDSQEGEPEEIDDDHEILTDR